MADLLLDSDVVINILKKKEETLKRLDEVGDRMLYLSPIVSAEIFAGIRPGELDQIETLFSYFQPLQIDTETGKIAGEYANHFRKAYSGISLEDYLIAASARQHHLILWTYNRKHYPMQEIEFF